MGLRPNRRNLVVFSSSARRADRYRTQRPTRAQRIRRLTRMGALLAILGVLRLSAFGRRRRSELERELAAYSTPAQRRDLEAAFDRYSDDVTSELREIMASQRTQGQPGLRG